MYQPSHFVESDPDVLLDLMRATPLATLVHGGASALAADVLPLEATRTEQGGVRLAGHVARANPLWRTADSQSVLVLFQGAQGYVSPSWYASKAAHGKVVPTWNYVLVQAYGTLRAIDDRDWLHAFVTRLTRRHESGRTPPWGVDDAPAEYVETMLKAIVGLEIEVTRLEGKFKLSQNRPADDRQGVLAGLAADETSDMQPGAHALARAMREAESRRKP